MKNYRITVNGVAYDVSVEEIGGSEMSAQAAPAAAAPPQAKAPVKKAAASGSEGSVKINAPMPGKIISVKAEPGTSVKKGDILLVLEAMKMENEIFAPQDGKVVSVNIAVGDMVESGSVMITMD